MAMSQRPQMIDEVVVVVEVVKIDWRIVAKDLTSQTGIDLVPIVFIQVLACCIEVQRAKLDVHTLLTQQQCHASRQHTEVKPVVRNTEPSIR